MAKLDNKYREQSDNRFTPYCFECNNCGYSEDLYYAMNDERPQYYNCPKCETKNSMKRIYNTPIHIPMDFASNENPIRCDKGPRGKKRFY